MKFALAGNPNCGKTSLFNALTGARQKVGNYPGVTVERKEGTVQLPSGQTICVLDLPGTYSLDAATPDEAITRDIILGMEACEAVPQVLVAVADATNLERSLGLVLELRALGCRIVLALNMMDLAQERGIELDLKTLQEELKVPVVATVATKGQGLTELLREIEEQLQTAGAKVASPLAWNRPTATEIRSRFGEVDRILKIVVRGEAKPTVWTDRIDRILLHPFLGTLSLILVLGFLFQAIFSWAELPMGWIESGVALLSKTAGQMLPEGVLRSLIVDGVIAGVGAVLVFIPQILLLFFFILMLEDSGYMARAAFLMDKLMSKVGLHGRAFIPLLSSFACAIPGIMATRTIADRRDRLTTILIAPLMTCSARLPVYSLLVAAFIPNTVVFGPIRLQGLVMLALYFSGVISALIVAAVLRKGILKGPKSPLIMELPTYKVPHWKSIGLGLWERGALFVRRAGTVILTLSILIWFISSYPKPGPEDLVDAAHPAIVYSYAGKIGHALEPLLRPLGFDWRISVALIPGFAAREVMVSALSTVYSIEGAAEGTLQALTQTLSQNWSLPVALSLLTWYVLACQCVSTLAVTRRETHSWRWPAVMFAYMTVLAYVGSFLVYQLASRFLS